MDDFLIRTRKQQDRMAARIVRGWARPGSASGRRDGDDGGGRGILLEADFRGILLEADFRVIQAAVFLAVQAYAEWLIGMLLPEVPDGSRRRHRLPLPSCAGPVARELAACRGLDPALFSRVVDDLLRGVAGRRLPPIGRIDGDEVVIDPATFLPCARLVRLEARSAAARRARGVLPDR
jgi:hypothetical protein